MQRAQVKTAMRMSQHLNKQIQIFMTEERKESSIGNRRRKSTAYSNFSQLQQLFKKTNIKPVYFVIPALFGLGAALFEGISIAALMPLVKGIVGMNFSFVGDIPVFKYVIETFPQIFDGNSPIFVMLLIVVFAAALLKNVSQYISSVESAYLVRKFSSGLRKLVFDRYLVFGKMFFDRTSHGYLQSVLLGSTGSIGACMAALNEVFQSFFILIIYVCIMFFISWKLTVFSILFIPLIFFFWGWLIKKIKKTSKRLIDLHNYFNRDIFNTLSCMSVVKLYTSEDKEKIAFNKTSDRMQELELSMDKKQFFIGPAQDIAMLIIVLLLISVASWMVIKEKNGNVANFLIYFYLIKRCTSILGQFNHLRAMIATITGPLMNMRDILDDNGKFFIHEGKRNFTGIEKNIELKNLTFSYREGVDVLKDASFIIERNKVTALVGPSGSGKTTIINLIMRFYDLTPGPIRIDGIPINDFHLKSLRKHMALVSQDTLLFNDTLRNNIAYGLNRTVTDEELLEVIKKARLYDFLVKLPNKLDTYIGDRGVLLSGGEKQRVSIARALLKGADILILDEATSSLDTRTEQMIQEAIDEAVKDKTVIVIAHRLSTIRNSDKIVVIENGQVLEEGALNYLLSKKGKFYEYWETQKFY